MSDERHVCESITERENVRMTERQKFREVLFEIELRKRKKVQEFLVKMGLTPGQGQARILSYLSVNDRVTQRETADACLLDATTMSRALDRLEKMGLIRRERDPGCRRAYRVGLTDAGRQKADEVKNGFRKLENLMCCGITDEEISALTAGLERVRENLKQGEEM